MKTKNMTTPHLRKSTARSPWRCSYLLIALALACFTLSPLAQAQLPSPTPDGGYPGNNTAEGDGALSSVQINATTGTGLDNTALGFDALHSNTTGSFNTATGWDALENNTTGSENTANGGNALLRNTTGNGNTAIGVDALVSNTTASQNTAIGWEALLGNTTGNDNTASGFQTLVFNTTGFQNTATGVSALLRNTTGSDNTASGFQALDGNTTGSDNTANGAFALSNTTGNDNTATGAFALGLNTTGSQNTATGAGALQNNRASNNTANGANALNANINGIDNTANGAFALNFNKTGSQNTATGVGALQNNTASFNTATGTSALFANTTGIDNTAEGFQALDRNTTGSSNIAVGFNAGLNLTTGSNNIDIGNRGSAGESSHIRIGTKGTQTATFIAGISGATVASGVGVIVGSNGQLGTVVSSERFKDEIKPMDKASEAILALKPVTFRYKKELDPDGIPQFGLVAEQVEKVNPDLVARDAEGKVYTVRYEAVNAMLLNEFIKEHRKVGEQETTIRQLTALLAKQQKVLTARLKEQDAKIQAVNERIERSKTAPQLMADNQ